MSVFVFERREPEVGEPLVKQVDVGGGYRALADLAAVELDGEAEAVADDVDDLPRPV